MVQRAHAQNTVQLLQVTVPCTLMHVVWSEVATYQRCMLFPELVHTPSLAPQCTWVATQAVKHPNLGSKCASPSYVDASNGPCPLCVRGATHVQRQSRQLLCHTQQCTQRLVTTWLDVSPNVHGKQLHTCGCMHAWSRNTSFHVNRHYTQHAHNLRHGKPQPSLQRRQQPDIPPHIC
jgi:hypothetical protein